MLSFAARLALPRTATAAERTERVAAVLRMLHLSKADAQTRIGSVSRRGLSGGQRKRVSIGIELLSRPAVLLVDEPTSGLDARMAYDVCQILRRIAQQDGRTVVATVHQPSSRLFCAFDQLLLLHEGRVVYGGAASAAAAHFGALGFPLPPQENLAEHLLHVLAEEGSDGGAQGGAQGVDFARAWSSAVRQRIVDRTGGAASLSAPAPVGAPLAVPARAVSSLTQYIVLTHRQVYDAVKDTRKLAKALGMRSLVGCVIGTLFFGQGRSSSFESVFPVTSTMFIAVLNSNLDTVLEGLLQGPPTRALLHREYVNGMYSCEAYFLALMTANMCQAVLSTLCLVTPLYCLVGFSPTLLQAGRFFATLCIMTIIGCDAGTLDLSRSRNPGPSPNTNRTPNPDAASPPSAR